MQDPLLDSEETFARMRALLDGFSTTLHRLPPAYSHYLC